MYLFIHNKMPDRFKHYFTYSIDVFSHTTGNSKTNQSLYLTHYQLIEHNVRLNTWVLRYGILFLKTSRNILRIEISKIRTNITLLVITDNVLGMLLLLLQLTLQYCDYTANF